MNEGDEIQRAGVYGLHPELCCSDGIPQQEHDAELDRHVRLCAAIVEVREKQADLASKFCSYGTSLP